MFPTEAISTLISKLNSRLVVPVHTSGIEQSRPVPAVMVEGMDLDQRNHHNSTYAGSEYNDSGEEMKEIHRHYYTMVLTLEIRDDDEVGAYQILSSVQAEVADMSTNPTDLFHPDVNDITLLGSGPVSYQYYEPTETELTLRLSLESFFETSDSDLDVIQSIPQDLNIS